VSFKRPVEIEMEAAFKANVMLTFSKGKNVESRVRLDPNARWNPAPQPCWNWDRYVYRVAKEPRRFWAVYCEDECSLSSVYTSLPSGNTHDKYVEFVEVLKPSAT